MRERELLEHIAARSADLPQRFPHVLVGPGDDCAVIEPDSRPLLLTTDQLVQGRHFDDDLPVDLIARKAVARSVSDLAAMGGRPRWALATALLPAGWPMADELFDRMAHWARHWSMPLVGGDIATHRPKADQPIVLTIAAGGTPVGERAIMRSGARPGDGVWVTGLLGGSLVSARHARFTPRLEEANALVRAGPPTAMIDLSDGLGVDAARLAAASGVTVQLEAGAVPIHPDSAGPNAGPDAALEAALADGEDYELLFTWPAESHPPALPGGTPLTRVGRVVPFGSGARCVLLDADGSPRDVGGQGFEHG